MLSNDFIDKLIQPLINRQNQIEMAVIQKIAKRIGEVKTMLPSDVYKLERLLKNGSDVREINKEIARLTKLQEKDIKKIIKTVAKDAYADAKPYYDYRKKPFISFEENEELQKAIKATEQVTLQEFNNLSNATAFMMRDPARGNFLFPTSISKTYQNMVDTAIHSVVFNSESYNAVIPKTIKELIDSGLKTVEYNPESGKKRTVRLDTAVRRNILDGIRNVNQTVQNITGEQFGADGVEIDVHSMSAPDHEPVQGHQFTKKEFFEGLQVGKSFIDVEGNYFAPIDRPIGLWNCTHNYMPIIIGVFKPVYTKEQLEQIKKNNANGYTYINKDGEKVTKSKYWCTQKMRDYELDIKKAKEGEAAAKLAKETDIEAQYHAEVIKKQNQYTQFCKDCGLKPRYENTRIYTSDSEIKSIDKIAESGIIESQGVKNITYITDSSIKKVPKISVPELNDEESTFIQEQHQQLLRYARDNNNNKEVAFVFSDDLGVRTEFPGNEIGVDFGTKLYGKGDNLFVMHNHPRNGSFSDTDIAFFLQNQNVKYLSIVKNNGLVEIIAKTKQFDLIKAKNEFKRQYKKYVKTGNDAEKNVAILEFLKKGRGGFEWKTK